MRHSIDKADGDTIHLIMKALHECYGSFDQPNFRSVSSKISAGYCSAIIQSLREVGIKVTDTTDLNSDVSVHLVLDRAGDQVGLALSGVGPFAAMVHQDPEGHYSWVTQSEYAPTPLAAAVAGMVQQAGFKLLGRDVATQSIAMAWYDGSTEVTLYQALFTDTDVIP